MSTLEEQMKALMAEAATATEAAAAEAGRQDPTKVELADQLSDGGGGRHGRACTVLGSRRGSRDLSAHGRGFLEAFEEIDTDKSGQIDHAELSAAILKMDPKATDKVISDMMKGFVDADDDGKVDFDEFKKIMLYKPPVEPSGSTTESRVVSVRNY